MAEYERAMDAALAHHQRNLWVGWYVKVAEQFSHAKARTVRVNWDQVQHTLATLRPGGPR